MFIANNFMIINRNMEMLVQPKFFGRLTPY